MGNRFVRLELSPDEKGSDQTCTADMSTMKTLAEGIDVFGATIFQLEAQKETRVKAKGLLGESIFGIFFRNSKEAPQSTRDTLSKDKGVLVRTISKEQQERIVEALGSHTGVQYVGEMLFIAKASMDQVQGAIFQSAELSPTLVRTAPEVTPTTIREHMEHMGTQTIFDIQPPENSIDFTRMGLQLDEGWQREKRQLQTMLETELNAKEILTKLCAILGIHPPLRIPIEFQQSEDKLGCVNFIITDVMSKMESSGRKKIVSFKCLKNRKISLNHDDNISLTVRRKVFIHELVHYLLPNMPESELLEEGAAEGIAWLYAEVFGEQMQWDTCAGPEQIALVGENAGWRTPDCAKPISIAHQTFAYVGGAMINQCLGTTLNERLTNLQALARVSSKHKKIEEAYVKHDHSVGKLDIVVSPSTEEWCNELDKELPGLGSSILRHPTMQPLDDCPRVLWHPARNAANPSSPWGVISAIQFKTNPNFGLTVKGFPEHLPPKMDDFDLNAATVEYLPFALHVSHGNGDKKKDAFLPLPGGSVGVNPDLLQSIPGAKRVRRQLRKSCEISVILPKVDVEFLVTTNTGITRQEYLERKREKAPAPEDEAPELHDTSLESLNFESLPSPLPDMNDSEYLHFLQNVQNDPKAFFKTLEDEIKALQALTDYVTATDAEQTVLSDLNTMFPPEVRNGWDLDGMNNEHSN